jgi:hypothetical protein
MLLKAGRVVLVVLCCSLFWQIALAAQPPDEKAIKVAINEDLKKNHKDYGADEFSLSDNPTIEIVKIGEYDSKGIYQPVLAPVGFDSPMALLLLVSPDKGYFRLFKDETGKWVARFVLKK